MTDSTTTTTDDVRDADPILSRVSDAVFALDSEWRFTYLNESAERLIDVDADEVVGNIIWDEFPAAVDSEFERQYRQAMETQEAVTFEEYFEPLDTWFEVDAYPSETGLSVYFRDITDRKERLRELERYRSIVETAEDGVYILDDESRFLFVNDAHSALTGYSREELVGAHASLVTTDEYIEQVDAVQDHLESTQGADGRETVETELLRKDGERVPVETTVAVYPLDEDRYGRVGIVRDVSDRKERERELERQRDTLQQQRVDLERLVEINTLVQRICREALEAESREAVEQLVCDELVDSEYYRAAWIGEQEPNSGIALRVGAGFEETDLRTLVDAISGESDLGPAEIACRRNSVQVRQNIPQDEGDPRQETFSAYDLRSSISLPLAHEGTTYGVVTIDTDRKFAFGGIERDVLSRMADTISQVLATVEHRQRYRSLVDDVLDTAAEVGIMVCDADGTVVWFNESLEGYLDIDREDVLGRDGNAVVADTLDRAFVDGEAFAETARAARSRADRSERHEFQVDEGRACDRRMLEFRSVPVETGLYADGRVDIYTDVTTRWRAERDQQMIRTLVEETATAETFDDALGLTIDKVCSETGFSAGEAWTLEESTETLTRVATSGDVDRTSAGPFEPGEGLVGRVYASGTTTVEDDAAVAGSERRTTVAVPVGTEDDVVAVLVYYLDDGRAVADRQIETATAVGHQLGSVMARKRTEAALRKNEQRFRSLVQEIEDYAIFVLDVDGTVTSWNDGAQRIKGYEEGEIVGEHFSTFYPEDQREQGVPEANLKKAEDHGRMEEEGWRVRKDGSTFWARVTITPLYDDDELWGFAKVTRDLTESHEHERERERLLRLNTVIRRINQTLVVAESHAEIESSVCELLADTDPYVFAWYGEVESNPSGRVEPKHWSGDGEVSEDDHATGGPTTRALETGSAIVCEDVTESEFDQWREAALERGYRSAVAIPISYGDAQYGVLTVYSDESGVISDREASVFSELGETIGHAKNAILRKEGLVSDTVTQLDLELDSGSRDAMMALTPTDEDGTIAIDETVWTEDGAIVFYVTVDGFTQEAMERFVEESDSIVSLRRIGDDSNRYEIRQSSSELADLIASHGGRIQELTVSEETTNLVVELPMHVDVRTFITTIGEAYPNLELVAQRTGARATPSSEAFRTSAVERLTEKQLNALEVAYFAGYFSWPRESDGEEIAETLDIAPSTFHQHLRTGEQKVFAEIFED